MLLEEHNTLKLLEFERGLQIESARLACQRRTDEQLAALDAYLEQMVLYAKKDHDRYLANDLDFHVLICEMSRNELYIKSMKVMRGLLYYALGQIVEHHDSAVSIQFHRDIAAALRARDVRLATHLMADHMDDVLHKHEALVSESAAEEPA